MPTPTLSTFTSSERNSLYATHGLHAYAAKCSPQIVRYGLRYYSAPGERVLDPMAGSGTSLVEARLLGRHAVGYDIDPLARLIAQVKARVIRDAAIECAATNILERTTHDLAILRGTSASRAVRERSTPPEFAGRDFWFEPSVCEALSLLAYHIGHATLSEHVRDFCWVAFSSLILAKRSVANARDIIHSRAHFWRHPEPPDVLAKFAVQVRHMRKKMGEFARLCNPLETTSSEARLGDARRLRIQAESIDLILTSPPYATALDYTRGHFLAVAWMRAALGVELDAYRTIAPQYIGSERGVLDGNYIAANPLRSELAQEVVGKLLARSVRPARLIHRYFLDMQAELGEMARVLRDGRHAIIVVCPSHIRKTDVPTHDVFAEMADEVGLRLKRRYVRTIYEHRRMLPYMQQAFGKRMSTEYILILQKR